MRLLLKFFIVFYFEVHMLDAQLIEDFATGFLGYGSYDAPVWFVGMEEGGGNDLEQVSQRIKWWDRRRRRELEDVVGYHSEFGVTQFWEDKPKLQATWGKLIRLLLADTLHDEPEMARKQICDYQRDKWGRANSKTCLLELLPMPSPSKKQWQYSAWRKLIPQLASRAEYRKWILPVRISAIRERIKKYRPAKVVFYGIGYRKYWQMITEINFVESDLSGLYLAQTGETSFFMTPHPAAHGRTNVYWQKIGESVMAFPIDHLYCPKE